MRKLLHLACALILSSQCFAVIALVQSRAGGSATGSGSMSFSTFNLASSAVGFSSPTTAGNLLVYVAWSHYSLTSAGSFALLDVVPTTSGFSWGSSFGTNWSSVSGGAGNCGQISIYYIPNAASMSVTTVATSGINGSGTITSANVEFSLYEFSGVAISSPLDKFTGTQNGVSSTPSTSNLATTATDLVIASFGGNQTGSNISAGTSYTLGVNATVSTVGQTQYQLNVPSGSVATAFSGGTEPNWGCYAMSFKTAAATSSVPRHRGWVF